MSKFGEAFAKARKGGAKEFDFNGKKFNTKIKGEGASKTPRSGSKTSMSKKSSLPKSAPMPTSRSSAVSSMSKKPSFSALTAAGEKKYPSGPSKRGGGPKIAISQANLDRRKAAKSSETSDKIRTPGKYKLPKF
jgi:hypothetical protein